MRLEPRWYQKEAVDSIIDFLFNEEGNATVKIATGGGKSLIIAEAAAKIKDRIPDYQIICLSDITSIIGSNEQEMIGQVTNVKTSIFSASFDSKDHSGDIVFAGIQSIYNKAHLLGDVSVVFIDEIHRASLAKDSMYYTFIHELKKYSPYLRIIGLSATPWKMSGSIEGTWICDKVIYDISMKTLLDEGFLCPIVTPPENIKTKFDVDKIKMSQNGEFNQLEMEKLFDNRVLIQEALKEAVSYAQNRNSWIIFASGVKHAEHIKEILEEEHNVYSEIIVGDTETEERKKIFDDFKKFNLRCIVSVNALSTGSNLPNADCGIVLRATQSSSLWVQVVGRIMRIHESKTNSLLLDFGGNIDRFGRIDDIKAPPSKEDIKKQKANPNKKCFGCGSIIKITEKECPFCGVEFGQDVIANHDTEVATGDVTGHKLDVRTVKVDRVTFRKHTSTYKGKSKHPVLKVTYHSGLETIDDYLAFESTGAPRNKACRWWELFADSQVAYQCPRFIDTATAELKQYGMKELESIEVDYSNVKRHGVTLFGHQIIRYNLKKT